MSQSWSSIECAFTTFSYYSGPISNIVYIMINRLTNSTEQYHPPLLDSVDYFLQGLQDNGDDGDSIKTAISFLFICQYRKWFGLLCQTTITPIFVQSVSTLHIFKYFMMYALYGKRELPNKYNVQTVGMNIINDTEKKRQSLTILLQN